MNPERTKKLAQCFAREWLRPSDPDNATETLVRTLTTAMLAFYAAARSADDRDIHVPNMGSVTPDKETP